MRVPFDQMQATIQDVFLKYGMSEENAAVCARVHTESSRDGIYSHGANRVARFVEYVKKGWVDADAVPVLDREMGAVAVYNGNLGPGITNALFATDRAIELADQFGIGMVGLHHTTHWMRGGTYGLHGAKKGYVVIAWTNTESNMPPWGGTEVKLGNNPFVMAAPTESEPVMIDMAVSQYAYGTLEVTRQAGRKLPFPGGFDQVGVLTNDPGAIEESKRILPMGYWKGASFSFMLDILGAVLSDGLSTAEMDDYGKGGCGGASQVFIVIDPEKVSSKEHINQVIAQAKAHIKSSELDANHQEIWYPGEDYVKSRKENTEKGVFVDDSVWAQIKEL